MAQRAKTLGVNAGKAPEPLSLRRIRRNADRHDATTASSASRKTAARNAPHAVAILMFPHCKRGKAAFLAALIATRTLRSNP
jgi:hypothetical protein